MENMEVSNMMFYNRFPRQYVPVTAYTADRPIYVNNVDINTGLYPVLNYQPPSAQYPYIYVPIAEFRRVGANVIWDPQEMVIRVTSDYDQLKSENQQLREELNQLQAQVVNLVPRGNKPWVNCC